MQHLSWISYNRWQLGKQKKMQKNNSDSSILHLFYPVFWTLNCSNDWTITTVHHPADKLQLLSLQLCVLQRELETQTSQCTSEQNLNKVYMFSLLTAFLGRIRANYSTFHHTSWLMIRPVFHKLNSQSAAVTSKAQEKSQSIGVLHTHCANKFSHHYSLLNRLQINEYWIKHCQQMQLEKLCRNKTVIFWARKVFELQAI